MSSTSLSPSQIKSLAVAACTAATYLDACDGGARHVRLDPGYYRACGGLLLALFSACDPVRDFPELLERSAAAREVLESLRIGRRLEISLGGYFPELAALLNRTTRA